MTIDFSASSTAFDLSECELWGEGEVAQSRRRGRSSKTAPLSDEQSLALDAQRREATKAEAQRQAEHHRYWVTCRSAILMLAKAYPGSSKAIFSHVGCVAMLTRTIESGAFTRDEILQKVRSEYRYSYRHAGFILTRLTGDDPDQHLWTRGEDRRYRILLKRIPLQ